jgi:hypothetical protein
MKLKYFELVAALATVLLMAGLQGCATTKPCQGKLQPINQPVAGKSP